MDVLAQPMSDAVVYPSSDGKRMAENTRQYEWIVTIKGNLDIICTGARAAFVAGDNLIYPVQGDASICVAPDVYVAFGRPRGHRGSYQVWREDNIFPQVIFEILSPSNTAREMEEKLQFYQTYGAEEYYVYDPDGAALDGWLRNKRRLARIADIQGHVSPRLGIQFDIGGLVLKLTGPDGQPFLTFGELHRKAEQERKRAEQERKRAEQEYKRAEREHKRAEQEQQRAEQQQQRADTAERLNEQLREKLRKAGIDPDQK